jgi:hypothetical protein
MSCGVYSGVFTDPDPNATPEEIICRGSNPTYTGTNWFNYWSQEAGSFCTSVFQNILYSGTNGTDFRAYNPLQLTRVQNSYNNIFAQYQRSNNIGVVNTPGYNAFQETILNSCENIPGVCQPFQIGYCSNCSRTQIASTALLNRICGCNAPLLPAEYNINDPACDPLCNRANAIHNINTITGLEDICREDVCVIDDINITATGNSTIQNGITFSQLCGNCKQDCACIIAGVNINGVLQTAGLTNNVQFSTSCANATCFVSDSTGNLTPTPCPKSVTFTAPDVPVAVNYSFIILIVIFVFIIIFAIFTIYS